MEQGNPHSEYLYSDAYPTHFKLVFSFLVRPILWLKQIPFLYICNHIRAAITRGLNRHAFKLYNGRTQAAV